jgi:hypothetical protein
MLPVFIYLVRLRYTCVLAGNVVFSCWGCSPSGPRVRPNNTTLPQKVQHLVMSDSLDLSEIICPLLHLNVLKCNYKGGVS